MCEIHQIVAVAAEQAEIEAVLLTGRVNVAVSNRVLVTKIDNLEQAVSDVFRRDLQSWRNAWRPEETPETLTKKHRREFYEWLLNLRPGERIIRYGCDRLFQKLDKPPRKFRLLPKKPTNLRRRRKHRKRIRHYDPTPENYYDI
jgi:hypothetical protein